MHSHLNKLLLPAVFSLMCLQALGQSAQPAYSRLDVQGTLPAGRVDAPIVYDAPGRRLLMFGGQDAASPRNDVWEYSLDRREWTELNPSGTLPPARFGHTTVFDPVRRRLVLFGGQTSGFFSDVWAYDISQNTWQQLSPDEAGPNRRYGHSAIYDAAGDRLIISHGFTDAGRFDDTWAFGLGTNTWQEISPSGIRPLRRCLHHSVYDEENGQMLLFGGCASGFGPCPLDDLWSFDLDTNQWTERGPAPKPAARQWYGMAFDHTRSRLVLVGGLGGSSLNDTWEYDTVADSWNQLAPSGEIPAGRFRHEATFVADLGAVLSFGGRTNSGLSNELWMLSYSSNSVVNAATFLPGPAAPGEILTLFGTDLASMTSGAGAPPLPTMLGGASVKFGGFDAPLFFVSPLQINFQVPWELVGQSQASLIVASDGTTMGPVNVNLAPFAPGLFSTSQSGSGQGAILISGSGGAVAGLSGAFPGSRPVRRGGFIEIFAIGLGAVEKQPASGAPALANPLSMSTSTPVVTIGGVPAAVTFSGLAPGFVGLYQVNAEVPANARTGDAVPVALTIGGVTSNTVTIAVQ